MDPFASPASEPSRLEAGQIDVGRAVSDGLAAAVGSALATFGAVGIGIGIYVVSICTCVGWIVALPALMWGAYRFVLEAVDGRAAAGTILSGFSDFSKAFVRMWGLTLLMLVLFLPLFGIVLVAVLPGVLRGEQLDPLLQAVTVNIPAALYGLGIARFMMAPLLIVDRDLGAIDAFSEAWRITSGNTMKLAGLQFLLVLLNAPAQVLSIGAAIYSQDLPADPTEALDKLTVVLVLQLATVAISAVASVLGLAFFAAAYRQLVPKIAAAPSS